MVQRTSPDRPHTSPVEASTTPRAEGGGRRRAAAARPGARFRNFQLVRQLGAGSNGAVWEAEDVETCRRVAVKFLVPPPIGEAPIDRQRFFLEAELTTQLGRRTRHVVQVVDAGIHRGSAFLVMELGESFAGAALSASEVARLVSHVGRALDVTHRAGFAHRDVKPANIILTRPRAADGPPSCSSIYKLVDYGIAVPLDDRSAAEARTDDSDDIVLVGTLAFMNPDLICGQPANVASDLWALGVTAYQLLTGKLPFVAKTWFELAKDIVDGTFAPLGVELDRRFPRLDCFFRRVFCPKSSCFQSATEVARELRVALELPTATKYPLPIATWPTSRG